MTDNNELLQDIEKGKNLNHVDEIKDTSVPKIEEDVHIEPNKHGEILNEIEGGKKLNHVDEIHDTSGPKIEEDVHIEPSKQPELLNELTSKTDKVEE